MYAHGGEKTRWMDIINVKTQEITLFLKRYLLSYFFKNFLQWRKSYSLKIFLKVAFALCCLFMYCFENFKVAERGQLYSKQNLQPNGSLTVSTFSFTVGDTILNSSCPYDFNHSNFWKHNPLSPLFYSIKRLSLQVNEQILWVLEPRKCWITGQIAH